MSAFFSQIMKGSKAIWVIYLVLCVLSCTVTFSAMSRLALDGSSVSAPIMRHMMFLILGAAVIMVIQILDFRLIRTLAPLYALFAIGILLVITIKGGGNSVANRFSSVGQPSEYVKLALILVMSEVIMKIGNASEFPTKFFYFTVAALVPVIALILLENLSTAIIICAILLVMMLAGGMGIIRVGRIALLAVVIVGCIIGFAYVFPPEEYAVMTKEHPSLTVIKRAYTWRARLDRHFDNANDTCATDQIIVTDENRQEVYAKVAVCRGGWFPSGLGSSLQRNYLPEAYSDYVFAIAAEEGGFALGIVIILLYLAFFMICLYYIIFKEKKVYRKLLLLGCSFSITFQAAVHIAVSVGAMPVTGQTLPLISRGGASLLVVSAMFGLIIKITATPSDQTSTYNPETNSDVNVDSDSNVDSDVNVDSDSNVNSDSTTPQPTTTTIEEPEYKIVSSSPEPEEDDDDDSIIIIEE